MTMYFEGTMEHVIKSAIIGLIVCLSRYWLFVSLFWLVQATLGSHRSRKGPATLIALIDTYRDYLITCYGLWSKWGSHNLYNTWKTHSRIYWKTSKVGSPNSHNTRKTHPVWIGQFNSLFGFLSKKWKPQSLSQSEDTLPYWLAQLQIIGSHISNRFV